MATRLKTGEHIIWAEKHSPANSGENEKALHFPCDAWVHEEEKA